MVDEHGGGLLHIVTASMEKRVKGEIRPTAEIVAVFTPGHRLAAVGFLFSTLPGIQADADGRLLVEG